MLSLILLTLLLLNYFLPFGDLDYTWQVQTGAQVVRTGQLRIADEFSYTLGGKVLPDFEWLYEVILWVVWCALGEAGLHLLKALLVVLPLLLVGWRMRVQGVAWYAALASLGLAVIILIPVWNLRPLSCTTIGLLLLSGWLHDHCSGRRPLSWETPLLMLLWTNMHPGVITGQGMLAGAIAWEWLNRWVRLNEPLSRAACWRLTVFGGLGLLATLVCPGPLERLHYTFNPDLAHPIMRAFSEMQPLPRVAMHPPYLVGLTYLVAEVVGATLLFRFRRYRLWEVATLLGLTVLGNFAMRSLQDWLLMMLALGMPHVGALVLRGSQWYRRNRRISSALTIRAWGVVWSLDRLARHTLGLPAWRFQPRWLLAGALALVLLTLAPMARQIPFQPARECPVAAADFIERAGLHGRFFASPNHGAYLRWRLGPRVQSYADTRGFFFPPRILEDCYFLPRLKEHWEERLERVLAYQTDYFLLENRGPFGALAQQLEGKAIPLYRDERTVLYRAEEVQRVLGSATLSRENPASPFPQDRVAHSPHADGG